MRGGRRGGYIAIELEEGWLQEQDPKKDKNAKGKNRSSVGFDILRQSSFEEEEHQHQGTLSTCTVDREP